MHYIPRKISPPSSSYFLLRPRGTGKSTWLLHNYPDTVRIDLLENLFLAFSIPVFIHRAKRRLIAHPKFYFFDVGVFRVLRPKGILDSDHEIEGIALESLVAQHLRT